MSESAPVQCPDCKWTGEVADLANHGDGPACPVCRHEIATVT